MKTSNLDNMTIDELLLLRECINEMLAGRIERERQQLKSQLARLENVQFSRLRNHRTGSQRTVSGRIYVNPQNPKETWSGRGRRPLWLTAAIKDGKGLDDFASMGPAKTLTRRKSKRRANGRRMAS